MTRRIFATPLDALRHHVTGAIERGEKEAIMEMPEHVNTAFIARHMERRQHSPIYRDMVDSLAKGYILAENHDYDAAYESCREDYLVAELTEDPGARMWADAAALLRRRANTVKGLRNA